MIIIGVRSISLSLSWMLTRDTNVDINMDNISSRSYFHNWWSWPKDELSYLL